MGATIDELEIQVSASASNASRNLTTLATRLGNLQKALSGVDVSKFNEISNSLNNLGNSANNLKTATNGLQNIGKNLNNIGRNVNNLNRGGGARTFFSSLNSGARSTTSSMGSLAAMIGKFYATYFMAIRGVKKLASSTKTAMDYVETLNYFNAAMKQVSERSETEWEQAGYASAEAYAKSFEERAKQVTSQMTGFTIDDSGNYTANGSTSVGLNLQDTMKYQAQYAQMASSMGVASDNAMRLSEVMIKLGGDLASVRNLDFNEAWGKLASGMVGMSRTMDIFGVNIRNANLQNKLMELGIDANINKLGQEDKVLLRTIVTLEAAEGAWSDLNRTLNQPANQLRVLQNNFKNLGQIIGTLFLPIVDYLLPRLNGMVVALQKVAQWLGSLLGIDMSKFMPNDVLPDNSALSDANDEIDDMSDGLGDASKNAKKLKSQLLGIDELNNITTKKNSGSGTVGAGVSDELSEAFNKAADKYLDNWKASFEALKVEAEKWASKFENILAPGKKLIEDMFKGDWESVGKDLSDIFTGIFDSASDGLKNVKWTEIGNKIGEFLKGIEWTSVFASVGNFIETLFDSAMDMWVGAFKTAPIETAVASAMVLCKFTGAGKIIANNLGVAVIAAIGGFSLGKKIGEALFPNDKSYYEEFGFAELFDTLKNDFGTSFEAILDMCTDFSNNPRIALMSSSLVSAILGPIATLGLHWYKLRRDFFSFLDDITSRFRNFVDVQISKLIVKIPELALGALNKTSTYLGTFVANILSAFAKIVDVANMILKAAGKETLNIDTNAFKFDIDKINKYANGGIVEDGLFMANHNELIGGFQGKTAVANNEQITRGIADAVRDANTENNRLLAEQNEILLGILRKTGITDGDIASSVRRSNRTFRTSTGYSLT